VNHAIKVGVLEAETNSLGMLSLFIERGMMSGHSYQPRFNHREMSYSSLRNTHGEPESAQRIPPFLKSVLLVGEEYAFDKNTPIGLTAYEIIPNEGEAVVDGDSNHEQFPMLRTQATMEVQMKEEEKKTHEVVYSSVRRVDSLKVKSFLRLLDVFGYTWPDAPDASEEVGLDAMVSLLKMLDQADLSSATGLECTLKHYNLDRLFKVDRTMSHEVNCARLGQTL